MTVEQHESTGAEVEDLSPSSREVAAEALESLRGPSPQLPCKLLYDDVGARLFEQICEQPEYYPTRTETAILRVRGAEIAARIGPHALVVEFGSGASTKTRHLLDALTEPAGYVPIDIAREQLAETARALDEDYPGLRVRPVCADYTKPITLPKLVDEVENTVVFFPGSTIGNFEQRQVVGFLRRVARLVGPGGGLLIGVDLKKDRHVLEAAYDDAAGVSRAFIKNVLARLNRECGAGFDLDAWRYRARWCEERSGIVMELICERPQRVTIAGETLEFAPGAVIHCEDSHKYSRESFAALAAEAGFSVDSVWTDDDELFSVQYLTADG